MKKELDIEYTIENYENNPNRQMLIGRCENVTIVTDFIKFSWITPLSLKFAKWSLRARFNKIF